MPRTLELFCLVFEREPSINHIFPLVISDTASVGTLKEKIKEKIYPTYHDTPAHTLKLWNVSILAEDLSDADLTNILPKRRPLLPTETLDVLFPDTPTARHLHIIVRPPHITTPPDPQPLLVLNCLILGDSRNNIFPVEITRAKWVGSLKKAIREEKHPAFQHIPPDTLTLWHVSEVVDANLENTLAEINFEERESLSPIAKLSKVFANPPVEDRLHIVVGRPTEVTEADLNEQRDKLTELRVKSISKHPQNAPSSGADPSTFMKEQKSNPIAIGRPKNYNSYPIPLSLFHAEFAQFKEDIVSGPLERELSPLAHKWSRELSNMFESEGKRESKFHELLSELFGTPVTKQKIGSFTTDGGIDSFGLGVKPVVVEVKNETTVGSSDAFLEIVLYDLEGVRLILNDKRKKGDWRKTRIPSLLIIHNGPNIQALGAIYLSDQYVEVLSPSLPLYFNEYDTRSMENLLRFMTALRRLFNSLCTVYKKPNDYAVDPSQVDFPYPRSYESSPGSSVQFTYVERISTIRLVFTARTEDKNIIVKFGHGRYGVKAHRAAAQSGLAPALLSHSVLAGGWWMVVMEPLQDGFKPCDEFKDLDQSCKDAITSSVQKLHSLGYVHGDLRDTNVFVRKHQDRWESQIIDYDWAGPLGDVVYPIGVFNNASVWRPDHHMDGLEITLEHDIGTLNEFFRRRTIVKRF